MKYTKHFEQKRQQQNATTLLVVHRISTTIMVFDKVNI